MGCRQFWIVPRSDLQEEPTESLSSVIELNTIRDTYGESTELVEDEVSNEAPSIDRDPKEVAAWMAKMGTTSAREKSDDTTRKAQRRDKSKKRRDSARDQTLSEFEQKPIVLGAAPTPIPKSSPTKVSSPFRPTPCGVSLASPRDLVAVASGGQNGLETLETPPQGILTFCPGYLTHFASPLCGETGCEQPFKPTVISPEKTREEKVLEVRAPRTTRAAHPNRSRLATSPKVNARYREPPHKGTPRLRARLWQ
eukprot:185339-Prorocentrum_minimum.AAC.2